MSCQSVPAHLREYVRHRAGDRRDYCGISQPASGFYRPQVGHIIPHQHGGSTVDSNLAWARRHRNLHKGPNVGGIEPRAGLLTPLFNPRLQPWADHFERVGLMVVGRSDVGRTTVRVLAMNDRDQLDARAIAV